MAALADAGAHPQGASLFGVQDLIGNVWQMTDEVVDDHTRNLILKGGSQYQPQGSHWYFPQAYKVNEHGKYLLMALAKIARGHRFVASWTRGSSRGGRQILQAVDAGRRGECTAAPRPWRAGRASFSPPPSQLRLIALWAKRDSAVGNQALPVSLRTNTLNEAPEGAVKQPAS